MAKKKTVFTQAELEAIVINTLTNLMVVVDNMTYGSDVSLDRVRDSLLKNKPDLLRWMDAYEIPVENSEDKDE